MLGTLKWPFWPWFFLVLWLLTTPLVFMAPGSLATKLATLGAWMACCGVFTIARPISRVGGYMTWFEKSRVIDGGSYVETPEEDEETRQGKKDALAVNIVGPALIVVGTMMNGTSGYFS